VFTGIIEASVPVASISPTGGVVAITLDLPDSMRGSVNLGDSIAVNGVCLTVAALDGHHAAFQAIPETMKLTSLGDLRAGSLVNLERAMLAGSRLDGHLVQGHVDATGRIATMVQSGGEWRLTIDAGRDFCDMCVHKGSVCIDGISLTIAELTPATLTVAIIPHTWKVTNLASRRVGDRVNLEADVIGKYVKRQLGAIFGVTAGVTLELLQKKGLA
jgi:riboflavin synthase